MPTTRWTSIVDDQWDDYIEHLKDYLKFPSVSALEAHAPDCAACADYLCTQFKAIGFQNVRAVPTPGQPIVWAQYTKGPDVPTVLVYGHYDVQPVDPLNEWDQDPFEPVIKDGYIYGRGTSDNKGQFWAYWMAFKTLYEELGELPVNVIVIAEGEEEIGSQHLFDFLKQHKSDLAADMMWVSDHPMLGRNQPSICTSLRGIACSEITITVAQNDLHSGLHGGAVPNALDALTRILVELKDPDGIVKIPEFYDGVTASAAPLSDQSEADEAYRESVGAYYLAGEYGKSIQEQRWTRPTLDIHGIVGGYQESGIKTVIPCTATAKVSMRLVGDQHPNAIQARLKKYVETWVPEGAVCDVTHFHGALPVTVSAASQGFEIIQNALERVSGQPVSVHGEGGSIPILSAFQEILGLDPIMMGLGLADDAIHAPNERFLLANARLGVDVAIDALLALGNASNTDS